MPFPEPRHEPPTPETRARMERRRTSRPDRRCSLICRGLVGFSGFVGFAWFRSGVGLFRVWVPEPP